MKNRLFSLLISWFMDGAMVFMQITIPLLALRFGAGALLLGTIGLIAQSARFTFCLASGHISERTTRTTLIIPGAAAVIFSAIGMAHATSNVQLVLYNALAFAALGCFYPSLQGMIGDISSQAELTKNLSSYNLGWCVGGALAAVGAAWLVGYGLNLCLYAAAAGAGVAGLLVIIWRRTSRRVFEEKDRLPALPIESPNPLLAISRMGLVAALFANSLIKSLFPQLGLALRWNDGTIASVVACSTVGLGIGMIVTSASPWWRGKLWPQIGAQALLFVFSAIGAKALSPFVFGAAFFCSGFAMSVSYTAALYHYVSGSSAKRKNAGVHDALVPFGGISGCLIGGLAAQVISLRAPYIILGCLTLGCLITSGRLWMTRLKT